MDKKNKNIEEKENVYDFYKDTLLKFIINSISEPKNSEANKEMENLIHAFSLFIVKSNSAYNYNLSFIPYQFKEFTSFLDCAKQKYDLLLHVVAKIKKSDKINNYLQNNRNESMNVSITINEFLVSNLNEKVDLCENFSINRAMCQPKEDIFTIEYKSDKTKIVRAKKVNFKYKRNQETNKAIEIIDFTPLIKLIEEVVGLKHNMYEGENPDE